MPARQAQVSGGFAQRLQSGDVAVEKLRCGASHRHEAVRVFGGTPGAGRGETAGPDRQSGLLHRQRGQASLATCSISP